MLKFSLTSETDLLELNKAVPVGQEEDVCCGGRTHLVVKIVIIIIERGWFVIKTIIKCLQRLRRVYLGTELGGAKAHLIVQPYLDSNLCLFKYHQVVNFVKITRLSIL